jgi:uncharacterized protein (TIGR02145 family)
MKLILIIVVSLFSANIYSQTYSYCLGETVYLEATVLNGNIQWEQSIDAINWSNIPGSNYSPFAIIFWGNKFYRAKITNNDCYPVYSSVKQIIESNIGCPPSSFPAGSIFCNGATAIVDVTNPTTGKIWMDRNLGATQAATSSTDVNSYGDLYQWGRRSDGHQCRTSATTATLSSIDQPANGNFILPPSNPNDWRSPQNANLWQGVNGVNNPCPSGYRIPSETELNNERLSWSSNSTAGALASPLKLPLAGSRSWGGSLLNVGNSGNYWSCAVSGTSSRSLYFSNGVATMNNVYNRACGFPVRCIKDNTATLGALNCGSATTTGTLISGQTASGVSSSVPYTGGNGGSQNGQSIASTGVTGLTATLAPGSFVNGAGSVVYTITGTPSAAGTASFALNIGGQTCTLTRTVNLPVGTIMALSCGTATHAGTLTSGTAASGVSSSIPYTGGTGGTQNGQTVTSTGVTGLTATLAAGTFAVGAGSLTYTITGTPVSGGTASFALNIGGQSCNLSLTVASTLASQYPTGSVFGVSGPTAIVDVTNPTTGKIWMDRNLGATQAATSSTDVNSYGDLYQWGRRSDGHQFRTSATTTTLSSSDQPAHGDFILLSALYDWRSPQNTNLWQGVNGVNNPCPSGYRIPTEPELEAERLSWSVNTSVGAFASLLKLPLVGYRSFNGLLYDVDANGYYWSSTVSGVNSQYLYFNSSIVQMTPNYRVKGYAVRCLKD